MALTPSQISELVKLRALGWSQSEIAEKIGTSQQVIGYQLKKLKKQSKERGTDSTFTNALMAGIAGATVGVSFIALLELIGNTRLKD